MYSTLQFSLLFANIYIYIHIYPYIYILGYNKLYCTVLYSKTNITVQSVFCKSPVRVFNATPNILILLVTLHNSYNQIHRRTPKYIARGFHIVLIYRIV